VEEYLEALQALTNRGETLPANIENNTHLPVPDDEHRQFLDDLRTLEKEGRRKYVL